MFIKLKDRILGLCWRLRSVPIFYKTIGVVGIFAVIFGLVIFGTTHHDLNESLYELLEERAVVEANGLAEKLALPMDQHDLALIHKAIERKVELSTDISYIIVRGKDGRIITHTFGSELPPQLKAPPVHVIPAQHFSRVLDSRDGVRIFELYYGIAQGERGFVQLGLTDRMVRKQLGHLASSTITSIVISVIIGVLLGVLLTSLIVQPIHNLKAAAIEVTCGNFEARSKVFSDDEIGELANAFNKMAASLQRYRKDMEEKERARLELIERVVSSHEDERKIISRELHDDLGQLLLAILMDIRSRKGASKELSSELESLETQIEQVIDEINHIISGMRPSVLDNYGIDQALESYLQDFSERHGIEVSYKFTTYDGFDRLPSIVEMSLYRIVQESLHNIVKYASASHVSILLIVSHSATTLLVEDDGIGFDPKSVRRQDGVGLVSMHERATLLGGAIDFESQPGQGTTIRTTIPDK